MNDEMSNFRRNAERLGLCDKFSRRWSECGSKLQLYKLACDINALAYMADMTSKGYGLSAGYLTKEFGQFLNGKCVNVADGYTSCIYCQPTEDIHIATTAALIIDCDKDIIIDKAVCELYIVNSKTRVTGKGRARAFLYNSEITNNATASAITIESR